MLLSKPVFLVKRPLWEGGGSEDEAVMAATDARAYKPRSTAYNQYNTDKLVTRLCLSPMRALHTSPDQRP